jgi:amino-acid N-acetyltransferase
MKINPARPDDISAIRDLLANNEQPLEGFPDDCRVVLALHNQNQVAGGIALEVHGNHGLLRSLVVDEKQRRNGYGSELVGTLLTEASALELDQVYLLTETAGDYFPRFGFELVDRRLIPPEVRKSVEFKGACPDSALAMRLAWKH